jgi:hypothetical protein
MKASVSLFSRLILWGQETLKVQWKPVYAPAEYCSLLQGRYEAGPAAEGSAAEGSVAGAAGPGAIVRCGELFEEAIYSADVLTPEKAEEFRGLVAGVTG